MPKTPADYNALAAERGFVWLGPEPENAGTKTNWVCDKGHTWAAAYSTIKIGHGCPSCLDMINGACVSKNQRALCKMVGGTLSGAKVGRYTIDVVTESQGVKIAVEYDSWFYHGTNDEHDSSKDRALLEDGWRVLRVRSNRLLPSQEQVNSAIDRLVGGELWLDIVLDDWGIGPTSRDLHERRCGQ
jgi:hypothetical protein